MDIPIIDGPNYNIYVERKKPGKVDTWDKAAIIEDSVSGETKIKFKSDGLEVPKPSDNKIGQMSYQKLWHKLLFTDNYVKKMEFIDYGDGTGDFVEIDFDEGKARASGDTRMFETHRNITGKKVVEIFSEDDDTQLWLAAYLTVLAMVAVGAMWFVTQGVENAVAKSVKEGIKSGLQGLQGVQGAAGDVKGATSTNMIPVLGLMSLSFLKSVRQKLGDLGQSWMASFTTDSSKSE